MDFPSPESHMLKRPGEEMKTPGFLLFFFFLASLGLCCCAGFFSSCVEWGLLSICSMQASHGSGFSYCGAQALEHTGFSRCKPWTQ